MFQTPAGFAFSSPHQMLQTCQEALDISLGNLAWGWGMGCMECVEQRWILFPASACQLVINLTVETVQGH